MNNNRWLQILIILLVIIAATYLLAQTWQLLSQFSGVLGLFFAAWLLAFVLSPIARALNARGMQHDLAVAVVYGALLLLFVGLALVVFPVLATQLQGLLQNLNAYTDQLVELGNNAEATLRSWGIKMEDLNLSTIYGGVAAQIQTVSGSMLGVVTGVAAFLFNTILVLLISFYMMKDGQKIVGGLMGTLPGNIAGEAQLLSESISRSFGGFIRGQLVFAIMYGILNALVMVMFSLDYLLIASIVAGFAMLIPLVGSLIAFLPPLFILLVDPDQVGNWWIMIIVLLVVQGLMIQVVSPRIMSQAVGMHPLFVIGAMLAGAQVAGIWGAVFGIPVVGAAALVARPFFDRMINFLNAPNANTTYVAIEMQPTRDALDSGDTPKAAGEQVAPTPADPTPAPLAPAVAVGSSGGTAVRLFHVPVVLRNLAARAAHARKRR